MVYVCADDAGMSAESCKRIEKCVRHGALNKVSVFPNTEMEDIKDYIPQGNITLGIHINLVEGRPVSAPDEVWMLVDDRGYFKYSFEGLFFLSVSPERREFERQISLEIKRQLQRWKIIFGDHAAALDSHQHTHMIPVIFRALMRIIREENTDVNYIRFPVEPMMPYLCTPSLYFTYKPINLVKQWVLNFLGLINRCELKKSEIGTALFMGILFSGKMDEKRVRRVLPHYFKLAAKQNKDIELLFHPGYAEKGETVMDSNKKSFNKFYYSKGRRMEFAALRRLK